MAGMEITPDQIRLAGIFLPYAVERQNIVQSNGIRFVHYTRADAAMNILKTKTVWMRKTSCMNDFMEVEHGLECLAEAYRGEAGNRLKTALNGIFDGVSDEIEKLFNSWQPHFRTDTYITCFSEHLDAEDSFGRLSMWRAFSGATGIALVLNNAPFFSPSNALKAISSPVAYLDDRAFQRELIKVVDGIENNADFVQAQGREAVIAYIFNAFKLAALCTKHPGFQEEKEWRVVYTPTIEKSSHLVKEIQVIGGTPQPIYKIPLRNIPEEGLIGVDIPEFLERIIIGPTEYSSAMREAFETLLTDAGVDDPAQRVHVSDIPLRV